MSKDEDYDYLFKLVLIGSSGVGKSNILARYTKNNFSQGMRTTVGVEFASKKLIVKDKIIKLQIWDTAGQERYKAIAKAYYKGAVAALLVYDITQESSFQQLDMWYKQINDYTSKNEIIIMLVGNKLDLESQRKIKRERGLEFAQSRKLAFHEVSAADGTNIDNIFNRIVEELYNLTNKPGQDEEKPPAQQPHKKEPGIGGKSTSPTKLSNKKHLSQQAKKPCC